MHEFKKSKANTPNNLNKIPQFSSSEELDDFKFDDKMYNSKTKVECICPKCDQRHTVAFHWIGRGTPRKYCQRCKGGFNG
jgi:hypothetical protein